jgi:diguanylate cyclase (GGDEF)-like protein/PAS domain S-box-containing protein
MHAFHGTHGKVVYSLYITRIFQESLFQVMQPKVKRNSPPATSDTGNDISGNKMFASLNDYIDELLEAICVVDKEGKFLQLSSGCERLFGYKNEELIGKSMLELIHPDDRERTLQAASEIMAGEHKIDFENRYLRKDGQIAHIQWSARWSPEQQVRIAVARDITKHKMMLNHLQKIAFYDSLTGLPNRELFLDRLQQAIARSRREHLTNGAFIALMFIDLDKFKEINDNFGHQAGDQALISVAKRLQHSVRETDTVARLGGDEFVILLDGTEACAKAEQIAEKILQELATPLQFGLDVCVVTASIGLAYYLNPLQNADEFMHQADIAMYQAKNAGGQRFRIAH